jgi:hypothetical protein
MDFSLLLGFHYLSSKEKDILVANGGKSEIVSEVSDTQIVKEHQDLINEGYWASDKKEIYYLGIIDVSCRDVCYQYDLQYNIIS